MEARSVGFIGGGRVAHIILGGWLKAGKLPDRIVVSDVSLDALNRLQARFPGIRIAPNDNPEAGRDPDLSGAEAVDSQTVRRPRRL
jgi:pyrroline-5-carboxylate reductase